MIKYLTNGKVLVVVNSNIDIPGKEGLLNYALADFVITNDGVIIKSRYTERTPNV